MLTFLKLLVKLTDFSNIVNLLYYIVKRDFVSYFGNEVKVAMSEDSASDSALDLTSRYLWRERHIGRLLLELSKDFQLRALNYLDELGYEDITLAYLDIVTAISVEGTRLTDIAATRGISKQAAGQMVKELVAKGYLTRQADPLDGRATLIMFTSKGKSLLSAGKQSIDAIEAFYARLVREAQFDALREGLAELLAKTRAAEG